MRGRSQRTKQCTDRGPSGAGAPGEGERLALATRTATVFCRVCNLEMKEGGEDSEALGGQGSKTRHLNETRDELDDISKRWKQGGARRLWKSTKELEEINGQQEMNGRITKPQWEHEQQWLVAFLHCAQQQGRRR